MRDEPSRSTRHLSHSEKSVVSSSRGGDEKQNRGSAENQACCLQVQSGPPLFREVSNSIASDRSQGCGCIDGEMQDTPTRARDRLPHLIILPRGGIRQLVETKPPVADPYPLRRGIIALGPRGFHVELLVLPTWRTVRLNNIEPTPQAPRCVSPKRRGPSKPQGGVCRRTSRPGRNDRHR